MRNFVQLHFKFPAVWNHLNASFATLIVPPSVPKGPKGVFPFLSLQQLGSSLYRFTLRSIPTPNEPIYVVVSVTQDCPSKKVGPFSRSQRASSTMYSDGQKMGVRLREFANYAESRTWGYPLIHRCTNRLDLWSSWPLKRQQFTETRYW